MRRSWLTTEMLSTLMGLILFIWLGINKIPIDTLALVVSSLMASLMINRALFKRDRTFFNEPAVKGSGEFVALVLNYALLLEAVQRGLAIDRAIYLMAAVQVVYVISRGWAKRNTVKQFGGKF